MFADLGLLSAQFVFRDTFEGGEVSPNGWSLLPFFCKVGIVLAEEVIAANAPSELKAFGSSHRALIFSVGRSKINVER